MAIPLLTVLFLCRVAAWELSNNPSSWNQTHWSLTSHEYLPGHFQGRLSLANGYVGASVAAAGPFFEIDVNDTDPSGPPPTNGWPLFDPRISFSTISGFYNIQKNATGTNYPWLGQYGWDSFIAGIPHPTAIVFSFGSVYLDSTVSNETIFNYTQTLSMSTGMTEWSYKWKPPSMSAEFDLFFSVIFSRERPNVIASKATIVASKDIDGEVTDLLDGRSAVRSYLADKGRHSGRDGNGIFVSVHPNGLPNVTAWLVSNEDFATADKPRLAKGPYVSANESTVGQTFTLNLKAGQPVTLFKYVGVASTDKFPDAKDVATRAASSAKAKGWDGLVAEHVDAWKALMPPDSVDDFTDPTSGTLPLDPNLETLQIGTIASTFHLLQNLQPDGSNLNDNSIPVSGLASDSYAGQIFWDADTWMAPGLNLAFPTYAKQVANFRLKQHAQALENAAFNGYPNGSILYSWTAGRYGNCTATGPCVDYEYHLNYDIAFNLLQQYKINENRTWFEAGPEQVVLGVAEMTAHLLQRNDTDGLYWLRNATDPDEYANNVNNPSFTISSASQLLMRVNELLLSRGRPANETWARIADRIAFPRAASGITLEYQTMNNSVEVKQADVVLITYPLGYDRNYTTNNSLLDLDYYSQKQSPDGPAMTFSAFAIDANAVSPSGCAAYTYTLKALLPYLRGPWYQFSEQQVDDPSKNGGTNPAFPFLTGHGGALQIAPFGFLGIRTDRSVLALSPSLPPQIPHLRVRTFYYAGAALRAVMNRTTTTLGRIPAPEHLHDTYAGKRMPFDVESADGASRRYTIGVNETVTVANRLYWENATYARNMLQCLPATSPDACVAGQLPEGANDGALATSWQPSTAAASRLLIDTSSLGRRKVSGAYFDFGERPVAKATILFYNKTTGVGAGREVTVNGIRANGSASAGSAVVPVQSNTTSMVFSADLDLWTGDWVQLTVEGCLGCDEGAGADGSAVGGTIAEFVVY
ncbi:putative acid trehalase protein [Drechmeria coniospora]|uniref:alpha,alpha-trehalase n=1 Tax=Drechmeria coniospora TaxID=98403 RepID=A0A151GK74_DRECN|nr:putative acid trehalase protein [Drechmeria coniospora]KYK57412.1 putative acid trehalase protein [Drechmeria coniospora]